MKSIEEAMHSLGAFLLEELLGEGVCGGGVEGHLLVGGARGEGQYFPSRG
jgi:hypothetical protein